METEPSRPQVSSGNAALEAAVDRTALAAILSARGRGREAHETLAHVLPMLEEILGEGHYEVGVVLETLAIMSVDASRNGEAAEFFGRALPIFERTLGTTHPRTVACRANHNKATAKSGNQGHGS